MVEVIATRYYFCYSYLILFSVTCFSAKHVSHEGGPHCWNSALMCQKLEAVFGIFWATCSFHFYASYKRPFMSRIAYLESRRNFYEPLFDDFVIMVVAAAGDR